MNSDFYSLKHTSKDVRMNSKCYHVEVIKFIYYKNSTAANYHVKYKSLNCSTLIRTMSLGDF